MNVHQRNSIQLTDDLQLNFSLSSGTINFNDLLSHAIRLNALSTEKLVRLGFRDHHVMSTSGFREFLIFYFLLFAKIFWFLALQTCDFAKNFFRLKLVLKLINTNQTLRRCRKSIKVLSPKTSIAYVSQHRG